MKKVVSKHPVHKAPPPLISRVEGKSSCTASTLIFLKEAVSKVQTHDLTESK